MKDISTKQPHPIERSDNSIYIYRWNITEKRDDTYEDITWYSYEYVYIYAPISADKITKNVMNEIYGPDIESKCINDYNSATLGILDESYIDKYKNFLAERKRIKEVVDADCQTYGIPKI